MDLINELKKQFPVISEAKFRHEKAEKILEITTTQTDLDAVASTSRAILEWMALNGVERDFLVDIASRGTEHEIAQSDWKLHLQSQVKVKLKRIISNRLLFEGLLEKIDDQNIYIRWNAKGQQRLQGIPKADILSINASAKIER